MRHGIDNRQLNTPHLVDGSCRQTSITYPPPSIVALKPFHFLQNSIFSLFGDFLRFHKTCKRNRPLFRLALVNEVVEQPNPHISIFYLQFFSAFIIPELRSTQFSRIKVPPTGIPNGCSWTPDVLEEKQATRVQRIVPLSFCLYPACFKHNLRNNHWHMQTFNVTWH